MLFLNIFYKESIMTCQTPSLKFFLQAAEFKRIGTRAVHEALEENRRLGIPSVFSRNRKIYYELPNGKITTEDPFPKLDSEN